MKRLFAILVMLVVGMSAATAQRYYDDRHFYDEEFDWHWDVRLRISEGENNGLLTRREASRLYKRLEQIERKEYAYMADGNYDRWEQNDIWDDVVWLNRRVGIELYDYDRRFYGFGNVYIGFNTYPFWYNRWYVNGWDFYRYDRLGWGSWRYGYVPRYYVPVHNVYVHNHIHKGYNNNTPGRTRYDNRNNETVIRRDRTDPANRVENLSRRGSTSTTPGSATRRSYESGSSSSSTRSSSPASSGRTYSPRGNEESSAPARSNSSSRVSSGSDNSSRSSGVSSPAPSRSNSSSRVSSGSDNSSRSSGVSSPAPSRSNSSSRVSSGSANSSRSSSSVSPSSGRSNSAGSSRPSSGSSSRSSSSSSGSSSRSSRN